MATTTELHKKTMVLIYTQTKPNACFEGVFVHHLARNMTLGLFYSSHGPYGHIIHHY